MNKIQKATTGLTLIALSAFGMNAHAQSNDNTKGQGALAFNNTTKAKTELVSEKKELNAPVVMPYLSSAEAQRSSKPANIGIHIHHDADDPISGFRYARGLANAATEAEKTDNRRMYITATYEEGASKVGSFVAVFVNGKRWEYEGVKRFTPQDLGKILPVLMYEFEQQFGSEKFIPEDVTPQLVASLN